MSEENYQKEIIKLRKKHENPELILERRKFDIQANKLNKLKKDKF